MACVICHDERNEVVATKLRYGTGRAVKRCLGCDLLFLDPRMTAEEERRFYEAEYGKILATEKGCRPEDLFERQLPAARTYLEWCTGYLRPTDKLLELGCASGYFLHTVKPHVAQVVGIESHDQLQAFCRDRGYDMRHSLADCAPGEFDVITLFFVFEHIGDPLGFLAAMRRALAPGGRILLVIPNVQDPLLSLYDIPAFRDFYFTPAHQYYYGPETMRRMAALAGLHCEVRCYQRYDLANHLGWLNHGKPGAHGRYEAILPAALRDQYRQSMLAAGYADAIFAILTDPAKDH